MRRPINATERLQVRQSFIPTDARCILEHSNGSALYVYETAGKLLAIAFWGTAGKPLFHYSYRTEEQRQQKVLSFKASVEQSVAYRETQKADRKARTNTLKVGDIVNTSWGYDQTNTDFYVVTRVSAACVWVRPIAKDYEQTGFMSGQSWPAMPIRMTGPETRHVARGSYFSIDGHSASLSEGRTHYTSSYA